MGRTRTRTPARALTSAAFAIALAGAWWQVEAQPYTFTHFAGSPGGAGVVDGTGSAARFNYPVATAFDDATTGNIYVCDLLAHVIRKVTPQGVVTLFAGSPGLTGSNDGIGTAARFNQPHGICVDPSGNVFVVDNNNQTIRKITPAGVVSTFAGSAYLIGSADGTGNATRFSYPWATAVDAAGNV